MSFSESPPYVPLILAPVRRFLLFPFKLTVVKDCDSTCRCYNNTTLPRIHKRTVAPATVLSLIIENSTFPLQSFEGKFKMSLQNAKTALRFSIPTLYLFLSILSVSGFSINRKSRIFLFPTQPVPLLRLLPRHLRP